MYKSQTPFDPKLIESKFIQFYSDICKEQTRINHLYVARPETEYNTELSVLSYIKRYFVDMLHDLMKAQFVPVIDWTLFNADIYKQLADSEYKDHISSITREAIKKISKLTLVTQEFMFSYLEMFTEPNIKYVSNQNSTRAKLYILKLLYFNYFKWQLQPNKYSEHIETLQYCCNQFDIEYNEKTSISDFWSSIMHCTNHTLFKNIIDCFVSGPSSIERGAVIQVKPRYKKPNSQTYHVFVDSKYF